MATGLVIHISSGDDRHTEILTDDRVRIGSSEGAELRIRASTLPKNTSNGVIVELARENGAYRIASFDASIGLTKNGDSLSVGSPIEDGDEIKLDGSDLALQFFPVRSLPAVVSG